MVPLALLEMWLDAQRLSQFSASICKVLLPRPWFSLSPWLMARDMFYLTIQGTHTCTYSLSQIVLVPTMLDGHCSVQFYSIPLKKNLGHDPLNWFHDPSNWFHDPLMCHDQQFEKQRPDTILAPLPAAETGKMEGDRGEEWGKELRKIRRKVRGILKNGIQERMGMK